MPTIPHRTRHEQSIEASIAAEYGKLRTQAAKNPAGVSWTDSVDTAQRELADELATVFLLALSGMTKQTGQDFNKFVAVALATDYANQRAAEVVSKLYDDLRTKTNDASRNAAISVSNGIPAEEAKKRFESELLRVFDPFRPGTIGVTEVTAAISAGEYAVGKPDKNKYWLALLLLYGMPDALEAWRNGTPGQTVRDLVGWPRMPRRRDLNEPAPGEWPTPTPRRDLPTSPELPGTGETPTSQENPQGVPPIEQPPATQPNGNAPPVVTTPTEPKFLNAVWMTENDERVCPVCSPLNGQPEAVWDKVFWNGPPGHPNCRCYLVWAED